MTKRTDPRARGALLLGIAALAAGCMRDTPCDVCDAVTAQDAAQVKSVAPSATQDERTVALGMALRSFEPPAGAEIVSTLLDGAVNPNAQVPFVSRGRRNAYFLELAVDANPDIVERLIEKGADVKGEPGGFALLKAADAGRADAVRLLLDGGAPAGFEWQGETPLGLAKRNGHAEAVKLLKERGATR